MVGRFISLPVGLAAGILYALFPPGAWVSSIVRRIPLALASPYYWGYDHSERKRTFMPSYQGGKDRYETAMSQPIDFVRKFWDRLIMSALTLCCTICVAVMWIKERARRGLILLLISLHLYIIITHVIMYWASKYAVPSMFCWLMGLGYVLVRGGRICIAAGAVSHRRTKPVDNTTLTISKNYNA